MIDPAVLRAMLDAGCSAEQIVSVAEQAALALEAKKVEKRAKDAERQRRRRNRNAESAMSRVTCRDSEDNLSPKERSPTPPKEITPIPVSEPIGSSTESAGEFAEFWSLFPNKVGKRDAELAFAKARKRDSFDAIMAGLRRYVAKSDDRPWCNPSTFLNQDRWKDQPAAAPPRASASPPRNVGELTILETKRGDIFDAPYQNHRHDDEGDRGPGFAGTGIARRIAIAASGRS